jgi:hypothetical protein
MLVAYQRDRPAWWQYLEVIEKALEDIAPLTEEAVPALVPAGTPNPSSQKVRHYVIRPARGLALLQSRGERAPS